MKKVFLIDDDDAVRFLSEMQFMGASIPFEAFSSFDPLEEILAESPDSLMDCTLLVDVNLPHENGDDFLLRCADVLLNIERIRIIVLTETPALLKNLDVLAPIIHYAPKKELVDVVKFLNND